VEINDALAERGTTLPRVAGAAALATRIAKPAGVSPLS
jgi:hypothetical protein